MNPSATARRGLKNWLTSACTAGSPADRARFQSRIADMSHLRQRAPEHPTARTANLDRLSTPELLRAINHEDATVPRAVAKVIPQLARAVEEIAARLARGGRLFYIGAGTSGRLGCVDASEMPPTY